MKIEKYGDRGIVTGIKNNYSFEIRRAVDTRENVALLSTPITEMALYDGKKALVDPYMNDMISIVKSNGMAGGLTGRKTHLIWGSGPALFKKVLKDGIWDREPIDDPKIMEWLESWTENGGKQSYRDYLLACLTDFNVREMVYTKVFRSKETRVGGVAKIGALENIPVQKCRLEYPDDKDRVNSVFVGDFDTDIASKVKNYPVFNPLKLKNQPVSVCFKQMPSFGNEYLTLPSWYSAKSWINLDSAMPVLLNAYTENSMAPKFHVIIPQSYVEKNQEMLQAQAMRSGVQYTDQMLEDFLDETLKGLANVLSGVENVGKFFSSRKFRDQYGEDKWEIIPIDQKVKDFIEAQLGIHKQAQFASTNAFQVPTALANISSGDGNLSSGSEILYSLKLYLATSTEIPEFLVMDAVNQAIQINFPQAKKQKIFLGFDHQIVKREENTTPSQRITNNT